MSFHEAGSFLIIPIRFMNVAYRMRPSGRVVNVRPDAPSHCLY